MTTVFITIDTEEDLWGVYRAHDNPVQNVLKVPMLQALFDEFGAMPTYLINWAVVSDAAASATIRGILDAGRCEVGTHCHPWNTPPYEEEISVRNSMMCNLPADLVWRKMETLHARIAERMDSAPVSFRAGRWGFNDAVASALARLGYRVDTSVSSTIDWSKDGGPDFTDAPPHAYRFSPTDIVREYADGPLLEVPPTIGFWQRGHATQLGRHRTMSHPVARRLHLGGILDRLHLLNHRWLSPEYCSGDELIRLAKSAVREGRTVLNMCFHSNVLVPGLTPFARDSAEVDRLLARVRAFLEFAAGSGFTFAPLSGATTLDGLR